MKRTPVIIAGLDCLSGVTTWSERLRDALARHKRYDVRLLYVGPDRPAGYDMFAGTIEEARPLLRKLAPLVLVPNYMWDLYLAGCDPGVTCLGMCHSDSFDEYYLPLSWYEPLVAQLIAVSPECATRLAHRIPHRDRDITTLPYGVPVPRTLERSYQTDPLRLIYAGRLTQPQKRVRDFLPLIKQLLEAGTPFVFDLVGDGEEMLPMQEALQLENTGAPVHFHGRLPHQAMDALWADHDVFVQVSDFEGTSVSMLEAMAHGVVPVVTAASSGVAGVVNHGHNGFVSPVGDMAAMAHLVAGLAASPAKLAAAGQAAHRSAQAFAMESYCEHFVRVLDRVVERGQTIDQVQCTGGFGGHHPLFRQHELIGRLTAEVVELRAQLPVEQPEPRGFLRTLRDRIVGRWSAEPAHPQQSRSRQRAA